VRSFTTIVLPKNSGLWIPLADAVGCIVIKPDGSRVLARVMPTRWRSSVSDGFVPTRALRWRCRRRLASRIARRLARREQTVEVEIARELLARIGEITRRERALEVEIRDRARAYAPALFELPGCGGLTAAKLIAEIAGAERFRSDAQLARHAGCAPLEASSGARRRHRFSRRGNRQLNSAVHRIAVTQARVSPEARAYLDRKRTEGKSTREALRCLKRQIVRRAFKLLRARVEEKPTPSLAEIDANSDLPPAVGLT
jgi:Transposase IS116/IS110/IS902 family